MEKVRRFIAWLILLGLAASAVAVVWIQYFGDRRPARSTADKQIARDFDKFAATPDTSLDEDAYIAMGFPACDREWSGKNLAVAAEKLKVLAASHPERLPAFESATSGRVFARMIDPKTLGLYQPKGASLQDRLDQIAPAYKALDEILSSYSTGLQNLKNPTRYERSCVEVFGADFRCVGAILDLSERKLELMANGDPQRPAAVAAHEKVRHAATLYFVAATNFLCLPGWEEDLEQSDPVAREKLLEYCKSYGVPMAALLTAHQRDDITSTMQIYLVPSSTDSMKPRLLELRDAILSAGPASTQDNGASHPATTP